MIFTNYRANNNSNSNVLFKLNHPTNTNKISNIQIPHITKDKPINKEKNMEWGAAIWYFFHILAEKVKKDDFKLIKQELFNMVTNICSNLPCPDCSNHAKKYVSNIDINAIKTKEDFKIMFLDFHNYVNKRKNKPIFTYDELNEKYSKGNINKIIPVFFQYFESIKIANLLMANKIYTSRIASNIRNWLSQNLHHFDV